MSFYSCLNGLPKINWAEVNRENRRYYAESYWCVVHYETNREWRRSYPSDITKYWEKTHPIRDFDDADDRFLNAWNEIQPSVETTYEAEEA